MVGTQRLLEGLAACEHPPKTLVAASAVGFYGDRGDTVLDESSSMGEGYLAEVCRDWETEALRAESLGIRVVCLRIGIVLAEDGGALEQMLYLPARRGRKAGQRPAMDALDSCRRCGRAVALVRHQPGGERGLQWRGSRACPQRGVHQIAGGSDQPPGVYAGAPPRPCSFCLARKTSIIMASQNIQPRRALGDGYRFAFPQLDGALNTLFWCGVRRALLWFRGKDLRVEDHEGLHRALAADEVIPVFVLDPYFFDPERAQALPHRMQYLLDALEELAGDLRQLGSELIIEQGRSVDVIPTLAAEWAVDGHCAGLD